MVLQDHPCRWVKSTVSKCVDNLECESYSLQNFTKSQIIAMPNCVGGAITVRYNQDSGAFSMTLAGLYRMTVTVNGFHIGASPFTIKTFAGVADHSKALAWGKGLVYQFSQATGFFYLASRDRYGNRRCGGLPLWSSLAPCRAMGNGASDLPISLSNFFLLNFDALTYQGNGFAPWQADVGGSMALHSVSPAGDRSARCP